MISSPPFLILLVIRGGFPQAMPFSQTYPMCCINIRNFVDQFYQFTDGVAQQHLDIDEVVRKVSCDMRQPSPDS